MDTPQQKVVQYLSEARASETALVRTLQSQISMTPRGSYRSALETHLEQTRKHADRVGERVQELGEESNPLMVVVGVWEDLLGQGWALSKTPFDLLRGSSGEEKVLKNAKDACATEALEIATYTAIERLARDVGDDQTAELAASIREDEEQMLARILRELPKLTDAVAGAEIDGDPSFDVRTTGAGEAVADAADAAKRTARTTAAATKRTARNARTVPGVAEAEGQVKGAVASEDDLAIAGYDSLTAEEIIGKLAGVSQIDLAKVDSYERRHQDRSTIRGRISTLRGSEPWPGYDELTVAEVEAVLAEGDDERAAETRTYERAHKNRAGVIKAAEREQSKA
jgi:ferritin-like metal-binding protein YciE